MDNVLIVVDDLEAVKAFFLELGFEVEGETIVEGPTSFLPVVGALAHCINMSRSPLRVSAV